MKNVEGISSVVFSGGKNVVDRSPPPSPKDEEAIIYQGGCAHSRTTQCMCPVSDLLLSSG